MDPAFFGMKPTTKFYSWCHTKPSFGKMTTKIFISFVSCQGNRISLICLCVRLSSVRDLHPWPILGPSTIPMACVCRPIMAEGLLGPRDCAAQGSRGASTPGCFNKTYFCLARLKYGQWRPRATTHWDNQGLPGWEVNLKPICMKMAINITIWARLPISNGRWGKPVCPVR